MQKEPQMGSIFSCIRVTWYLCSVLCWMLQRSTRIWQWKMKCEWKKWQWKEGEWLTRFCCSAFHTCFHSPFGNHQQCSNVWPPLLLILQPPSPWWSCVPLCPSVFPLAISSASDCSFCSLLPLCVCLICCHSVWQQGHKLVLQYPPCICTSLSDARSADIYLVLRCVLPVSCIGPLTCWLSWPSVALARPPVGPICWKLLQNQK
jgi:hypothetical protein